MSSFRIIIVLDTAGQECDASRYSHRRFLLQLISYIFTNLWWLYALSPTLYRKDESMRPICSYILVGSCGRIWCTLELLFHACYHVNSYVNNWRSSKILWNPWFGDSSRYSFNGNIQILFLPLVKWLYKLVCLSF